MGGAEGAGDGGQMSALDAAYQQLATYGPVADGRSVSLTAVARATGMSRTNLYRRWPTSADLAADIAVHRATSASGWHAAVCVDDGTPLSDAVRRSLASPGSNEGVLTRASVSLWAGTKAHAQLAAWERAHWVSLVERLRREWGHEVAAPWTDTAVVLTALMDGMHLMWAQSADEPDQLMSPELAEETAQMAVRIVDFMVNEAEGADVPLREASSDVGEGLPQRVADALADGSLDVTSDSGRRVVDMGILARSRGVSERSLYARWPSAADLNADLYLESVARVRTAFARILLEVFQSQASGAYNRPMPLIARMNEWFMDPERFPEAGVHLGLVDVLSGQEVLDRVREPVKEGLRYADMQTSALLQATGFRLLPDVRTSTYTMFIVGMGMGSHRTSSTHPELLERRLRYLGEEYLAAGVGHTAMTRSCTELVDPTVEEVAPSEPPIPPALQPIDPPD